MALEPNYLSLDFDTIKTEIINNLKETDTFKDYDFEGSNISILIELISYLGDLNTYYLNKLSKNLYLDTVEIYENIHRIAELTGYTPLGYSSSSTYLKVSLTQDTVGDYFNVGDSLYIPKFRNISAQPETSTTKINFTTVENGYKEVDLSWTENGESDSLTYFEFDIPIKQGQRINYNYTGKDIYNNKIFLPFLQFDNQKIINTEDSVWLTVNGEEWQRVNTFFEDLSALDTVNKLFRFSFDKYKRYYLEFSPNLTVPDRIDEISVDLIQTLGEEGNVGKNMITTFEDTTQSLVYNTTKGEWIPNMYVTVTNPRGSAGGKSPETVSEIRSNTKNFFNTQYRCITSKDYKNYLERYPDILKGSAWGQQELKYQSDVRDYNKVYLTVIPETWGVSSINTLPETWNLDNGNSVEVDRPQNYLQSFKDDVEEYLAPYKTLNSYHSYSLPDLVYFAFDITLSVAKNYDYSVVLNAVKSKLEYIFSNEQCNFADVIDFREIEDKIKDTEITSEDDDFTDVKKLKYIRIRDIHCDHDIYAPNEEQWYPQYERDDFDSYVENKLRVINLGPGQFPILKSEPCLFST